MVCIPRVHAPRGDVSQIRPLSPGAVFPSRARYVLYVSFCRRVHRRSLFAENGENPGGVSDSFPYIPLFTNSRSLLVGLLFGSRFGGMVGIEPVGRPGRRNDLESDVGNLSGPIRGDRFCPLGTEGTIPLNWLVCVIAIQLEAVLVHWAASRAAAPLIRALKRQ